MRGRKGWRHYLWLVNIFAPFAVAHLVSELWGAADMSRVPVSTSLIQEHHGNLVERNTPFISALGRQRQLDLVSSRTT